MEIRKNRDFQLYSTRRHNVFHEHHIYFFYFCLIWMAPVPVGGCMAASFTLESLAMLVRSNKQKGKCRTTFVDLPGPAAITGQPSRESAVWNSLVASTQIYIYDLINEKKKSLYFFSFPISNSLRSNRVPCSWISILDQCRPGFLSTSTRCCCW